MKISHINSRQILDSRGNPTVETDVILDDGTLGRAAVPSGASTGIHEALELRDGDDKKYGGKGVTHAVQNVTGPIADKVVGMNAIDQVAIDQAMIDLDGTDNKSHLGANAILSVSLATAKAAALAQKMPLYQYAGQLFGNDKFILPLPMMNLVNGGAHAAFATDIQEFIIFPASATSFAEALRMGAEVFHALAKVLKSHGYPTTVGDEGGYAPKVQHGNKEAFDLLTEAISTAGYDLGTDILFGTDAAASEFYKDGKYHLNTENKVLSTPEMVDWLVDLVQKYPLASLEDCLDQEDWQGWQLLTQKLGATHQIVGDDLFVTNTKFIEKGIAEKTANAVLIKVNQIGTLTETINAIKMTKQAGWNAIISHRSGETEDTTIAHLVVGFGTGQIKTGSLSRSERVAKYNELLRIEEQLGENAVFVGNVFKK